MITFGQGERLHSRTAGPSRWGAIRAPDQQLARYGRALSGAGFVVPPAAVKQVTHTPGRRGI
jgi:hypothetical protein